MGDSNFVMENLLQRACAELHRNERAYRKSVERECNKRTLTCVREIEIYLQDRGVSVETLEDEYDDTNDNDVDDWNDGGCEGENKSIVNNHTSYNNVFTPNTRSNVESSKIIIDNDSSCNYSESPNNPHHTHNTGVTNSNYKCSINDTVCYNTSGSGIRAEMQKPTELQTPMYNYENNGLVLNKNEGLTSKQSDPLYNPSLHLVSNSPTSLNFTKNQLPCVVSALNLTNYDIFNENTNTASDSEVVKSCPISHFASPFSDTSLSNRENVISSSTVNSNCYSNDDNDDNNNNDNNNIIAISHVNELVRSPLRQTTFSHVQSNTHSSNRSAFTLPFAGTSADYIEENSQSYNNTFNDRANAGDKEMCDVPLIECEPSQLLNAVDEFGPMLPSITDTISTTEQNEIHLSMEENNARNKSTNKMLLKVENITSSQIPEEPPHSEMSQESFYQHEEQQEQQEQCQYKEQEEQETQKENNNCTTALGYSDKLERAQETTCLSGSNRLYQHNTETTVYPVSAVTVTAAIASDDSNEHYAKKENSHLSLHQEPSRSYSLHFTSPPTNHVERAAHPPHLNDSSVYMSTNSSAKTFRCNNDGSINQSLPDNSSEAPWIRDESHLTRTWSVHETCSSMLKLPSIIDVSSSAVATSHEVETNIDATSDKNDVLPSRATQEKCNKCNLSKLQTTIESMKRVLSRFDGEDYESECDNYATDDNVKYIQSENHIICKQLEHEREHSQQEQQENEEEYYLPPQNEEHNVQEYATSVLPNMLVNHNGKDNMYTESHTMMCSAVQRREHKQNNNNNNNNNKNDNCTKCADNTSRLIPLLPLSSIVASRVVNATSQSLFTQQEKGKQNETSHATSQVTESGAKRMRKREEIVSKMQAVLRKHDTRELSSQGHNNSDEMCREKIGNDVVVMSHATREIVHQVTKSLADLIKLTTQRRHKKHTMPLFYNNDTKLSEDDKERQEQQKWLQYYWELGNEVEGSNYIVNDNRQNMRVKPANTINWEQESLEASQKHINNTVEVNDMIKQYNDDNNKNINNINNKNKKCLDVTIKSKSKENEFNTFNDFAGRNLLCRKAAKQSNNNFANANDIAAKQGPCQEQRACTQFVRALSGHHSNSLCEHLIEHAPHHAAHFTQQCKEKDIRNSSDNHVSNLFNECEVFTLITEKGRRKNCEGGLEGIQRFPITDELKSENTLDVFSPSPRRPSNCSHEIIIIYGRKK